MVSNTYFYKYKFVSPDPLYTLIRDEFRSYFDSGVIDSILFPIYTNKCLRRLGKSSYKIDNAILFIDNHVATLPPNFRSVKEAWACKDIEGPTMRNPGSFYQNIITNVNDPYNSYSTECDCDPCNPDVMRVVTKTNTETNYSWTLSHLLVPGNTIVREEFGPGCLNYNAFGDDKFDIRDGKLVTSFREGTIYLAFYADESDQNGYQLIPENFRIQEYIEAFIKQKIVEQLLNQVSDESFQQLERKLQRYTQEANEAYIIAEIEVKKPDIYQRVHAINRDLHRNDKYIISYRNMRSPRRRFL